MIATVNTQPIADLNEDEDEAAVDITVNGHTVRIGADQARTINDVLVDAIDEGIAPLFQLGEDTFRINPDQAEQLIRDIDAVLSIIENQEVAAQAMWRLDQMYDFRMVNA